MQSYPELLPQFEARFAQQFSFPARPEGLYEPCSYFLGLGGKRIRPVLCLMGNELFGNIDEAAWHAANAVELFHNFTLVHDDIMDKAPLRRGKPTVHTRNGLTAGILCGDVICIYAYQELGRANGHLQKIMPIFSQTAIEVCEGQQLDMDYEQRHDVTVEEYIHMITLKTSVLLAASLKMGALIGGATGGNAGKVYSFGKNLGIAFQLQDDYLDAFGEEQKLGKQSGGDIQANKKTYLLLKALEQADDKQRNAIESLLQSNNAGKVAEMRQLFRATGADAQCRAAVKHYSDLAFTCLEEIAVTSARKQPLKELAEMLLQREF